MKRPDLPPEHCANQSSEMARKVFVQSIAPCLKGGSMDARSAISQLEMWREHHPEAFTDWRELCLKYVQQPPEWVDWLIQGVKATSEDVVEADKLVAAAQAAAAKPLAQHGTNQHRDQEEVTMSPPDERGNSQAYILRRIARDRPELLGEIGPTGRFKSARAAAIEAGIITPLPSLQLKEPVPTAQKLLDKKGKEWCLALLDELSGLIFED